MQSALRLGKGMPKGEGTSMLDLRECDVPEAERDREVLGVPSRDGTLELEFDIGRESKCIQADRALPLIHISALSSAKYCFPES
jgi:hypothetical protein